MSEIAPTPMASWDPSVLAPLESEILRVVLYTNLFKYPLTLEEICDRVNACNYQPAEIEKALEGLVNRKLLYPLGDFYSTQHEPRLAERRTKGNAMAASKLKLAQRIASLIHRFPFVRSVMISGSLSKDYMDERSDLDFFLITKAKRLWLVKAAMVFIKRIILFGSYRFFCVNYLIDEDHLEIEEHNQFTATELITVIPVTNKKLYEEFIDANHWVKGIYPNAQFRHVARSKEPRLLGKRFAEWLLGGAIGTKIDQWAMGVFDRHTMRKYQADYTERDFKVAFKTKEHVSKYHEKNFQRKVMDHYTKAQEDFQQLHQVVFS